MVRWLLALVACCIVAPVEAKPGIARWDALPAVDVMHLQGPYAGRSVCPMCKHGYDAGLLVFLPSSLSPANAGRIARELQVTTASIDHDRFRSFLILTGEAPSEALLSAVESADAHWYVAHLSSSALSEASRDFAVPLDGRAVGYVFAQRRLLWSFDPNGTDAPGMSELPDHARYAMTFLHATYAQPAAGNHPDAPQGRLWTAPSKLSSQIALTKDAQPAATRTCFSGPTASSRRDALVALTLPASATPQRTWWARTDDTGCVALAGAANAQRIHTEVFSSLQPIATTDIDANELRPDRPLQLRIGSTGPRVVTGREPVVNQPCENCEAVFQGLPAQLDAKSRLAPSTEPGEPLQLSGTVKNADGAPQADIVVYAYQTDWNGRYPADPNLSGAAARHGRLRGWTRTDANGHYRFQTIRPGGYPGHPAPQHIHMHVIEPGRCSYFVGDVLFADDPRLTATLRSRAQTAQGGSGIVQPQGDSRGGWNATRDITLGLNVSGYDACSA